MSTTLEQLRTGHRGRILSLDGDDSVAIRLMEMGIMAGVEIESLGSAPLGDPLAFFVRGYRVALRTSEARRIRIEVL